jgi:hypothetical protein
MNKRILDKQIICEPKLERLGVKGLGHGKRTKLGGRLESKREGVKVGRDREAAHTGKEEEGGERGGQEGVGSNDVVVAKG